MHHLFISLIFFITFFSFNSFSLVGEYTDNDDFPYSVCTLVQKRGADSMNTEVLHTCSGTVINGLTAAEKMFITTKTCEENIKPAPSLVFCSGRPDPYYVKGTLPLYHLDISAFALDGDYSQVARFQRVTNITSIEDYDYQTSVFNQNTEGTECALFSHFGSTIESLGQMRGVLANQTENKRNEFKYKLNATLTDLDLGAPLFCRRTRTENVGQNRNWILMGLTQSYNNLSDSETEVIISKRWITYFSDSNRERLNDAYDLIEQNNFSRNNYVIKTVFIENMFSTSESIEPMLVSKNYNFCNAHETSYYEYTSENSRSRIILEKKDLPLDLSFEFHSSLGAFDFNYTIGRREECLIGQSKTQMPSRYMQPGYGLKCGHLNFSYDGTKLMCDGLNYITPSILSILSGDQVSSCKASYDSCFIEKTPEFGYDEHLSNLYCSILNKSCMYNLPELNIDILQEKNRPGDLDEHYSAYYDVASIQSLKGNKRGKLYLRDSTYLKYEKTCIDEFNDSLPRWATSYSIEMLKSCLLKNPQSYTGYNFVKEEIEAEAKKRERLDRMEKILDPSGQ